MTEAAAMTPRPRHGCTQLGPPVPQAGVQTLLVTRPCARALYSAHNSHLYERRRLVPWPAETALCPRACGRPHSWAACGTRCGLPPWDPWTRRRT